jgi:hypothetical protein
MTFQLVVQKFLNIERFFHWKFELKHSWNFWRNWNVPLVFLERSWWGRFNEIYLVKFGLRMWEILIFKWFMSLKIQINSKTLGFWRKNQSRTWITFECLPFNSSRRNCDVPLVLLEKSWWFKFNGIYVMKFRLRMWDNVDRLTSCYVVMIHTCKFNIQFK